MWQDYILTIGSLVFVVNLLPSLFNKETYIPRYTSLPTAFVLFLFSFTQYTLHLYFSSATQSLVGVIWLLLAFYRGRKLKNG